MYGWGWGMNESGKPQKLSFPEGCAFLWSCRRSPECWNAGTKVVQVAAGAKHSLALSDQGLTFSWGSSMRSAVACPMSLLLRFADEGLALGNEFSGSQAQPTVIEGRRAARRP